jgi:hypothetical protein
MPRLSHKMPGSAPGILFCAISFELGTYVRRLGLKSVDDWRDYMKSGAKPDSIPVAPHYIYSADGWAGWGDWLGPYT